MKYTRMEMNPGVFADYLPEGAKMYQKPDMPTFKFKRDGVTYTLTDPRLLNPAGIEMLNYCLCAMVLDPDAKECRILAQAAVDNDTVLIAEDIVMGFRYKAEKKGKNGWSINSGIVEGFRTEYKKNGDRILVFQFFGDFGRYAYEYAQINDISEGINLPDLIVYVANREHENFQRYWDNNPEAQKQAEENAKALTVIQGGKA